MLKSLNTKVEQMKAAIFVNFSGIPVKEINVLRNNCREQGIEYVVTKKTLLRKTLLERGMTEEQLPELGGEIATLFAYGDEVAAAKLAQTFAKDHDKLKIVAGFLGDKVITGAEAVALSKLPSKPELLAKAVGSIAAPLSGFVNVLQGNLRSLVYVMSAIKDQKSQ